MAEEGFVYLGFSNPIVLSGTSFPRVVGYLESIHESVMNILTTMTCSRRMRPEYGSTIYKYLFDTNDPLLESRIKIEVRRALTENEPRITVVKVMVSRQKAEKNVDYENLIVLDVVYRVKGEYFQATIIYPELG